MKLLTKTSELPRQFITIGGKLIEYQNILYFEASRRYCTIVLTNGNEHFVSKPLKYYENKVVDLHFFRCHKSYLVNIKQIDYCKSTENLLKLKTGHEIKLSRYKVKHLKEIFCK